MVPQIQSVSSSSLAQITISFSGSAGVYSKSLEQVNITLKQEKKELQGINDKQATLIESLMKELTNQQPQAPLMTTHDEQELINLLSSKDEMMNNKDKLIQMLEETIMKMREELSLLDT